MHRIIEAYSRVYLTAAGLGYIPPDPRWPDDSATECQIPDTRPSLIEKLLGVVLSSFRGRDDATQRMHPADYWLGP